MSAMDSQRAMLDALMGKGRNRTNDDAPIHKQNWDDINICPYFLCEFCPHDLFINTKSDLGPCDFQHLPELKQDYNKEPRRIKRRIEKRLLRFLYELVSDVDRRIRRGKDRIALNAPSTQPNPILQQQMENQKKNIDLRCKQLSDEINKLKEHISVLCESNNEQKLNDATSIFKQVEKLQNERETFEKQSVSIEVFLKRKKNGDDIPSVDLPSPHSLSSGVNDESGKYPDITSLLNTGGNINGHYYIHGSSIIKIKRLHDKNRFEICEICGVFQAIDDAEERIARHFDGKQHKGYAIIRDTISKLEKLHAEELKNDASDDRFGGKGDDRNRRRFSRERYHESKRHGKHSHHGSGGYGKRKSGGRSLRRRRDDGRDDGRFEKKQYRKSRSRSRRKWSRSRSYTR